MRFAVFRGVIEDRCGKRGFVLRIGDLVAPAELRKFRAPAASDSFDQRGIAVTGEILEGPLLTVFFAHEKQRNERRQERHTGGELRRFEID